MKKDREEINKFRKITGYLLLLVCAIFILYLSIVAVYRLATVSTEKKFSVAIRFFGELGIMLVLCLPALDVRFGVFSWLKNKGLRIAGIIFRLTACVFCILFVALSLAIITTGSKSASKSVDKVCVLGLSIDGDKLPQDLIYRLEKAMEYKEANPQATFILTGGNNQDIYYTEAEQMKRYLQEQGVNVNDGKLITETQATTTVENFIYSAAFLNKENPVGVITNDYHIFRASKIAKKQGYTSIVAIPAKSNRAFYLENIMWETICSFFETLKGEMKY